MNYPPFEPLKKVLASTKRCFEDPAEVAAASFGLWRRHIRLEEDQWKVVCVPRGEPIYKGIRTFDPEQILPAHVYDPVWVGPPAVAFSYAQRLNGGLIAMRTKRPVRFLLAERGNIERVLRAVRAKFGYKKPFQVPGWEGKASLTELMDLTREKFGIRCSAACQKVAWVRETFGPETDPATVQTTVQKDLATHLSCEVTKDPRFRPWGRMPMDIHVYSFLLAAVQQVLPELRIDGFVCFEHETPFWVTGVIGSETIVPGGRFWDLFERTPEDPLDQSQWRAILSPYTAGPLPDLSIGWRWTNVHYRALFAAARMLQEDPSASPPLPPHSFVHASLDHGRVLLLPPHGAPVRVLEELYDRARRRGAAWVLLSRVPVDWPELPGDENLGGGWRLRSLLSQAQRPRLHIRRVGEAWLDADLSIGSAQRVRILMVDLPRGHHLTRSTNPEIPAAVPLPFKMALSLRAQDGEVRKQILKDTPRADVWAGHLGCRLSDPDVRWLSETYPGRRLPRHPTCVYGDVRAGAGLSTKAQRTFALQVDVLGHPALAHQPLCVSLVPLSKQKAQKMSNRKRNTGSR